MAGFWVNNTTSTLNGWTAGANLANALSYDSPVSVLDTAFLFAGSVGDLIVLNQTGLDASGNALTSYSSASDFTIDQDGGGDLVIPAGQVFGITDEPLILRKTGATSFEEVHNINFLPDSLINAADTANPDLATEIQPVITALKILNNRGVYYNGTDDPNLASTKTYDVSAAGVAGDSTVVPPTGGGGSRFGFV